MDDSPSPLLDPEVIAALLRRLQSTDVEELEVAFGDARVYVRREAGRGIAARPATDAAGSPAASESPGVPVAAPLAGVFYSRPGPDDAPFVQVGDLVEVGQTVGLIETMKMYNEVSSEVEGEVVAVVVAEGELVSKGQPLVYLKSTVEGGA